MLPHPLPANTPHAGLTLPVSRAFHLVPLTSAFLLRDPVHSLGPCCLWFCFLLPLRETPSLLELPSREAGLPAVPLTSDGAPRGRGGGLAPCGQDRTLISSCAGWRPRISSSPHTWRSQHDYKQSLSPLRRSPCTQAQGLHTKPADLHPEGSLSWEMVRVGLSL